MDSRAAVFTSSPQSVEVYQAGTWWSGELLGWRHDASGTCQMWVRVVVGGVEEAAWIDLAALRLPERELPPVTAPGRIDARVKQELPTAQAVSALRGRAVSTDAATTAALPMVRERRPTVAARGSTPAGTAVPARPSGRRRAPEVDDVAVADPTAVPVPVGRHRAPRDEGRHRAADTEVFTAVPDETDRSSALPADAQPAAEPRRAVRPHAGMGRSVPSARAARPEESSGRSEVCTGRIDVEPDLLTRPMRLSDLAPASRRPRVGGSVPGV
jgi:hypothetical protein